MQKVFCLKVQMYVSGRFVSQCNCYWISNTLAIYSLYTLFKHNIFFFKIIFYRRAGGLSDEPFLMNFYSDR